MHANYFQYLCKKFQNEQNNSKTIFTWSNIYLLVLIGIQPAVKYNKVKWQCTRKNNSGKESQKTSKMSKIYNHSALRNFLNYCWTTICCFKYNFNHFLRKNANISPKFSYQNFDVSAGEIAWSIFSFYNERWLHSRAITSSKIYWISKTESWLNLFLYIT